MSRPRDRLPKTQTHLRPGPLPSDGKGRIVVGLRVNCAVSSVSFPRALAIRLVQAALSSARRGLGGEVKGGTTRGAAIRNPARLLLANDFERSSWSLLCKPKTMGKERVQFGNFGN